MLKLEEMRADFAENLRTFFPVIEVEVIAWRAAARTDDMRWDRQRPGPLFHRRKGLSVAEFKLDQELPVIFLVEDFFLNSGGSVSGGLGSTMKLL